MQLFKIKVVKKDGKEYKDLYLAWYYDRVRYERVSPTFWGFSTKVLFARAIEVKNLQELKEYILEKDR